MLVSKRALYNICFQAIKESVSSKYDLIYESEDKTEEAPAGFYDKTQVSKAQSTKSQIGSMSDRPVKVSPERKAWIDDNIDWLSAVPSEMDGIERPFGDLETFEEKVYLVLKKADIISDRVKKISAEKYAREAEEARKRREEMQMARAQSIIDDGDYPDHTFNVNDLVISNPGGDSFYSSLEDMSDMGDSMEAYVSSEDETSDIEPTFKLPPRQKGSNLEKTEELRESLSRGSLIRNRYFGRY